MSELLKREMDNRLERIGELEQELKTQLEINEKLKEVIGFYGYVESWRNSGNAKINRIKYDDTELLTINYDGKWLNKVSVGGKRARKILKELE